MHLRRGNGEAKLVRCSYGAIFDVIVDLRPTSPTYRNWESFELRDSEQVSLYVPAGCAHGFQALTDPAERARAREARLEIGQERAADRLLRASAQGEGPDLEECAFLIARKDDPDVDIVSARRTLEASADVQIVSGPSGAQSISQSGNTKANVRVCRRRPPTPQIERARAWMGPRRALSTPAVGISGRHPTPSRSWPSSGCVKPS